MISLDYSIIYQILLFLVLWIILSKVLFRPYLHLLEERERRTIGAQHDSTELEREGARLRAQYEEQIARAQAAGYTAKEAIVHRLPSVGVKTPPRSPGRCRDRVPAWVGTQAGGARRGRTGKGVLATSHKLSVTWWAKGVWRERR